MKIGDIYDLPLVFDPDWPRDANGKIVHISTGDAIHAVNCHDDLVEALNAALDFIVSEYSSDEAAALQGDPISRDARPIRDKIVAAIAKSEASS